MTLLSVDRLTVTYGAATALDDVTLTVPAGCVIALLGANGTGKTTLLRSVSGLVHPTAGVIRLDGVRLDGRAPHDIARLGVQHVRAGRSVFASLSVRANLELSSARAGRHSDPVGHAVSLFPWLGQRLDDRAATLSGGEQQLLALARAFVARPRLLLVDELSTGLAPLLVDRLVDSVRASAERGVGVLLVEQYVSAALRSADYVYVLDRGRVVDVGEPADVADSRLLHAYLGATR